MVAFWTKWDPSTIGPPALEGFLPLERIADCRRLDCPPCPLILLPIADVHGGRVWVELASAGHPGGRIFHSAFDESVATLWAVGLSDLLDSLSCAFERDAIDERSFSIDAEELGRIIDDRLDQTLAPGVDRQVEAIDRSRQPSHWQRAEGLDSSHFALRGSSHTVAEFDAARHGGGAGEPATLVGTYRDSVGGGPLRGNVGEFADATGSLQVFVPESTLRLGAIGAGGLVEIDAVAMRRNGIGIDTMSARAELQLAASLGTSEVSNELLGRLAEEMSRLDTSVIVTAMRPIR